MKPLPVVSYTEEDWQIMCAATRRWWLRHRSSFPLGSLYVTTDRRDAERMLGWRRFRLIEWRTPLHEPNVWWLRDDSEPRWQPIGGQL
jgi:hypothetical protein